MMPSDNVDNQRQSVTVKPEASPVPSSWKLENSSVWWLSYFWDPGKPMGWLNSPGNILLLTSVPFFAGAYFGYRMPTEQLEDLIQGSVGGTADGAQQKMPKTKSLSGKSKSVSPKAVDQDAIKVVAARTASKALRIATLGTVGFFGFVGAVGFYISGYESLEKAVIGTKIWASSWGKSLEHAMGGDQAASKSHPDVLATKDMNGEDELRYIYDKYIKEGDDGKDTLWLDEDAATDKKGSSPTLYAIYQKYFKKEDD